MIRYRVVLVALSLAIISEGIAEDASQVAEDKIRDLKPPDKLVLEKSKPYSEKNSSDGDLSVAATGYVGAKYLPPFTNYRGHSRSCYDCNSEPWIPIIGRSLHFQPESSHSNSLEDHQYYALNNKKQYNFYQPPIDQYGAPRGVYHFPPAGEVVEFMLPPPYQTGHVISGVGNLYDSPSINYVPPKANYGVPLKSTYGAPLRPSYGLPSQPTYGTPLKPIYGAPKPSYGPPRSQYGPPVNQKLPPPAYQSPQSTYGAPVMDIAPPPYVSFELPSAPRNNYGSPLSPSRNHYLPPRKQIPTTHLRPVSQDFQPPLPGAGIHTLPLENNLPPAIPSDSYGRPITANQISSASYVEPITLGSGDSEDSGKLAVLKYRNHHSGNKVSLHSKGLTDVQVVPSVRIADYTASIEHPINIVQSPILDLNIDAQDIINQHIGESIHSSEKYFPSEDSKDRLSENPIVVDDTHTSASNINTTYSSDDDNSTAFKRYNDNYFDNDANNIHNVDLTDNLVQKLILEHNIMENPKTSITDIQKNANNPDTDQTNFNSVQPSLDYSSWAPTSSFQSDLPTHMVPPANSFSTWLSPVNESYNNDKTSKKLQIIVPYLKASQNDFQFNNKGYQNNAIYNKEYTTLAPIFVPPPMTTERTSSLWTQLAEDFRTVESLKEPAKGFIKSPDTTEVYNIKDFFAKQKINNAYDILSLQKNIDDWTHQSYANRPVFGAKLTTKLSHVKKIPGEYFTTTSAYIQNVNYNDHTDYVVSGSNKKEFISNEINEVDNIVKSSHDSPTETSKVKFIVKQPKPAWDESKVVLSNSTHEKVYVVTPQSYTQIQTSTPTTAFSMAPKVQNGKINNATTMTRISVRVETPSGKEAMGKGLKPVKVIYSEWPHLINYLETTTTEKPTTRHPLFGLMDLAPFTVEPNSTIETIAGHSKVTSVVTSQLTISSSTTPMPRENANETVRISSVK